LWLWADGRHEPYGRLEGSAGTRRSRYTWGAGGKEYEEETGHVNFGVRDYDPMSGLWMSQDPMMEFASLYEFVGGFPLNMVDPDGMETVVDANYKDVTGTQMDPSDLNVYMQLGSGAMMPITAQNGNAFYWYGLDDASSNSDMRWAVAISKGQVSFKEKTTPKFSPRSDLKEQLLDASKGHSFVITATRDGKHAGKGHIENRAVDIRTWDRSFVETFEFQLRENKTESTNLILGPYYYWKRSGNMPTSAEYWGHTGDNAHLHFEVK